MGLNSDIGLPDGTLVSAKRGSIERTGMHRWHPYYAGYSEAFVDRALNFLGCDGQTRLLDPWGGSGTTAIVAARSGISSVSGDVNPVMSVFTSAKDASLIAREPALLGYLKSTPRRSAVAPNEPLKTIFDDNAASIIRAAVSGIPFERYTVTCRKDLQASKLDVHNLQIINSSYAFCLSAIFITARRLADLTKRTNPTWLSAVGERVSFERAVWNREIFSTAVGMLADLNKFYANLLPSGRLESLVSDARSNPFSDESIDAIITSPPYLTRIDYAMATAPEMQILGTVGLSSAVRSATMGAPVINPIVPSVSELWGETCLSILDKVYNHPTKAAKSYYWKTMMQYFDDMSASLANIQRVLKPGGRGVIVVQSSYFKDVLIPLGDIYVEAARKHGMYAKIVSREEVRSHMTHVNTRSRKYLKDRVYHEDVVQFRKL